MSGPENGPFAGQPKPVRGRFGRFMRLSMSICDPRAWLHLFKLVNYYNYTHVSPLRAVSLGANPSISPDVVFSNPLRISIGDRVRLGSRCHLWAGHSVGQITIGHDVLFGPEVLVTAATYQFHLGSPVTRQPMREADVVIGNDVWLATRAVILPGTTIGDGAIVGAGAVVKGHIPAMAIVAGSPAVIVGQRNGAQ